MTRTQLERFRGVLEAKREDLAQELKSWKGPVGMSNESHQATLLTQVEAACRRMEDGSFGVCLHCGAEIPPKRLEIIPWARYCVACQPKSERLGAGSPGNPASPQTLAS